MRVRFNESDVMPVRAESLMTFFEAVASYRQIEMAVSHPESHRREALCVMSDVAEKRSVCF